MTLTITPPEKVYEYEYKCNSCGDTEIVDLDESQRPAKPPEGWVTVHASGKKYRKHFCSKNCLNDFWKA